jgi:hypothetical protein
MEFDRYKVVSLKKEFMLTSKVSENETQLSIQRELQNSLGKFERSKILEVYFARFDGREPSKIPVEYKELYEIDLSFIKRFLLNQNPRDAILQQLFRMMN